MAEKWRRSVEYVVIVFKLWGDRISGPIFAIVAIALAIIAGVFADNASIGISIVKVSAWLTGILSVILIFVAQFNAWSAEREKYEGEVARNLMRPNLVGEIRVVIVKPSVDWDESGLDHTYWLFGSVCNYHAIETNISDVIVRGIDCIPPLVLLGPTVKTDKTTEKSEIILRQGIETELIITVAGTKPTQELDLSRLEVKLKDAFGGIHKLPIKAGLIPILPETLDQAASNS